MSILDRIQQRYSTGSTTNAQAGATDDYNPVSRLNFVSAGNAIELGTEIIHELLRKSDGLSDQVGDQRLLKRDISSMIGARLTSKVQEAIDNSFKE